MKTQKIFSVLILIFICTSNIFAQQPYGTLLGYYNGVSVYSNGNINYVSNEYNYYNGTNTGMKWQCVEFVNRFYLLIFNKNIRIAGTNANEYHGSATQRGLYPYSNISSIPPAINDILCFGGGSSGYGHVVIIREVGYNYVKIAQQNGTNNYSDTSFTLTMTIENGLYNISASNLSSSLYVQGWLKKELVQNVQLTLLSSGKIFYNEGTFSEDFQFWHLGNNSSGTAPENRPWTRSNIVGNPPPSVTYTGFGHQGSNHYTMGGIASNLIYKLDVMFTNPPTAEGIYMNFRIADSVNYYSVKYGPYYGGILVLSKNVGGIGSNIVSPIYGIPSTANTWYNLEVRAIGSSLKVYFNHTLRLNATDISIVSGLTSLGFGICCSASNTWYVDNIKVFKSYEITVNNLQPGQKVELYDSLGVLKSFSTVSTGQTSVILDVESLAFPFTGYFKVYSSSGTLLYQSPTLTEIWGGDTYKFESQSYATTKIAFQSKRTGNWEIFLMNPDGTNPVNITNNSSDDGQPAWSPNGEKIAFSSSRDGNLEIYTMNIDGTNLQRLTNNSSTDGGPDWSPDGTKIAFGSNRDGNYEIYVMNSDGSSQINLTNNSSLDGEPRWSPDGTKILFSSWREGPTYLFTMSPNGSNVQKIPGTPTWVGSPGWAPDGQKIGFSAWGSLYTMNVDGTNRITLLSNPGTVSPVFCSFSTDGNKIAFFNDPSGQGRNHDVYTMNVDGTNVINLTNSPSLDNQSARWSPYLNPVNVEQNNHALPKFFILSQNYPNPFNPSTTIKFALPERANVKLTIYNMLGEKVTELVNGELDAGYHKFEFNANSLPSGIYFYELNAGKFREVKKMVLHR